MSIKHEHWLHPVTALEFLHRDTGTLLLLAGEGRILRIYEAHTSKLLGSCVVFQEQTIHGIVTSASGITKDDLRIAIWGSSSLSLLSQSILDQIVNQDIGDISSASVLVSDWILYAAISPSGDDSCMLITAHNTILRTTLYSSSQAVCIDELNSPSRSILYSAHLVWESSDSVLVAAGTVFGEIIVWQCSITPSANQSQGSVLYTFTGHEGSIFGVNISMPVTRSDRSTGRFLASCSDDRTIRVWDIGNSSTQAEDTSEKTAVRETGFGGNGEVSQSNCLAIAMGHASRIWQVKFVPISCISSCVGLLSFGEDATTQQWNLELENTTLKKHNEKHVMVLEKAIQSPTGHLSNQNIYAFHSGKHIWSAAIHCDGFVQTRVITGGSDGKISSFDLEPHLEHTEFSKIADNMKENHTTVTAMKNNQSVWDLEKILTALPGHQESTVQRPVLVTMGSTEQDSTRDERFPEKFQKIKQPKRSPKDAFNRYAFVSNTEVILTTTFGRVLLGLIGTSVTWTEILLPEARSSDLKSYSVVTGLPKIGVAVLAGVNGKIYVFDGSPLLVEVGKVADKVADLFSLFNPITNYHELLVTSLGSNVATLFQVQKSLETIQSCSLEILHTYSLPSKFVVTATGRTSDLFALGSRTGSILLYMTGSDEPITCSWASNSGLSGDAITSITPLPKSSPIQVEDCVYLLITSRKGIYSIIKCIFANDLKTTNEAVLCTVHCGTPPFGPIIDNAWFQNGDLFLYGFKSKNFIVWDETQQYEIQNVECGGAHRSFAYLPLPSGGRYVYTKASKLYLHNQLGSSHQLVKSGGHGREIKACAVSGSGKFFATGAEDTAIRIWTYKKWKKSYPDNKFNCLAVVQKHTTGIQHLQWYEDNYLFSSGGNEEFYVWAVESIPGFGIGIICEATCPITSKERDLRIMSFDICKFPSKNEDDASVLVVLAFSDSTIRLYKYSKSAGFTIVSIGRYTSSCLMHIRYLDISKDQNLIYFSTAATDGNLTSWRANLNTVTNIEPVPLQDSKSMTYPSPRNLCALSTKKIHQNSIKSLDLFIPSCSVDDEVIVVTGGDDNALGISIYSISSLLDHSNGKTSAHVSPKSFILRSAHAAAITGLCIILDSNSKQDSYSPEVHGTGNSAEQHQTRTQSESESVKSRYDFSVISSSNDQRVKRWNINISVQRKEDGQKAKDEDRLDIEAEASIENVGDEFTAVADVGDMAVMKRTGKGKRVKLELGSEGGEDGGDENGDDQGYKILIVGNGMDIWDVSEAQSKSLS